jgi:hypothetical protein
VISTFIELGFMYLIFILCTARNGAIPILRRMREQHESDSEDEEDVEDVARQYFILVYFTAISLILYVIYRAVDFCTRDP